MRISDWSSDVCSSDLEAETRLPVIGRITAGQPTLPVAQRGGAIRIFTDERLPPGLEGAGPDTVMMQEDCVPDGDPEANPDALRSEEHTYELTSLMPISYAALCLKK